MRLMFASTLAVLLVTTSSAQIAPAQVSRPMVVNSVPRNVQPAQSQSTNEVMQSNDPETLKRSIEKLQHDRSALYKQLRMTLTDLQNVRLQLDDLAKRTALSCVGDISKSGAGQEENCEASGYACNGLSGACFRECTDSAQCRGFNTACNTATRRCEAQQPG